MFYIFIISYVRYCKKRCASFRDAAFMGIMRWAVYGVLKEEHPDVSMTFGYKTKNARIENGLEKSHIVDARCISGNPLAAPAEYIFVQKKVRRHNRQMHRRTIGKGAIVRETRRFCVVTKFELACIITKNELIFGFGNMDMIRP